VDVPATVDACKAHRRDGRGEGKMIHHNPFQKGDAEAPTLLCGSS
jgi:hypothetical protein